MPIAVTGTNGFLGGHVVDRLAKSGHSVTAIGRDIGKLQHLAAQEIDLRQSDYSVENLTPILRGIETVVHLASGHMTRQTDLYRITQFQENTVALTEKVLIAALDAGVKRICLASSQSVYSRRNTLPFREAEPAHPANVYGVAKLACENLAELVGELGGLEVVNLRLARLYGQGDRPGLMIPTFIGLARRRETLHVAGTGRRRIDLLYVKDAAAALAQVAVGAVQRGTFNIGSGKAHSVRECAETVNSVFGNDGNVAFDQGPETSGDDIEMDATLARDVLGWTPRWTLAEALEDMRESA